MSSRLSIAIAKEHAPGERRVVLLPNDVAKLVANDVDVYVERDAGIGIGIEDAIYRNAGANIVSRDEVWKAAPLVVKYKPPVIDEFDLMHEGLAVSAIYHAEGNRKLTNLLCTRGIWAFSYEFFRNEEGIFPIAKAGGNIAGKMAMIYAAYHLQTSQGGSGILLSSCCDVPPPHVVVIGHGNVGGESVRMAQALGCKVTVFGRDAERLDRFRRTLSQSVSCKLTDSKVLRDALRTADVVIGAILISTYDTPPLIRTEWLKEMKPGAIIIDATSGYGPGYMESFDHQTTLESPTYLKEGILHCKIDNLPAAVPITSSTAFSSMVVDYVKLLSEHVTGVKNHNICQAGCITKGGVIQHLVVKAHMEQTSA